MTIGNLNSDEASGLKIFKHYSREVCKIQMLIEKSIHPFYTGKGRTFYNAECVCVSYHKAREVGSVEALQGEGVRVRGWLCVGGCMCVRGAVVVACVRAWPCGCVRTHCCAWALMCV